MNFFDFVKLGYHKNKLMKLCRIEIKEDYKDIFLNTISKYWGFDIFDEDDILYIFSCFNFNSISKKIIDSNKSIPDQTISVMIVNSNLELLEYFFEKKNVISQQNI